MEVVGGVKILPRCRSCVTNSLRKRTHTPLPHHHHFSVSSRRAAIAVRRRPQVRDRVGIVSAGTACDTAAVAASSYGSSSFLCSSSECWLSTRSSIDVRSSSRSDRNIVNGAAAAETGNDDGGAAVVTTNPTSVSGVRREANDRRHNIEQRYPPGSKLPQHHHTHGDTTNDPVPTSFHLAPYGEESLYTLVLLRHGESEWNIQNRFTGWCDVNLTSKGQDEARSAGRLLYENGIEIDHAYTSVLKRASFSCNMALNTAQQHYVPVTKTWRLNERHYGALQGFHKDTAYKELGFDQELVMQMRRAYGVRPPRMSDDHIYWHGNDRRYRKLTPEQLEQSRAESLKDTTERIMPFWKGVVIPSIEAGNKCLIVCHANTIRTLIKHIDQISDEDIKGMTIPTGIPLLYRLDKHLRPVDPQCDMEFRYMIEPKGYTWGTSRAHGFHGVYLGDLERLQDIQIKRDKTNRDWQRIILRNIGKALGWDMDHGNDGTTGLAIAKDKKIDRVSASGGGVRRDEGLLVIETRQLWFSVHQKMGNPEYGNMLLLTKMEDWLEDIMFRRGQKYITKSAYEKMINKVHLDAEGQVVEPFVNLSERQDRQSRQNVFYDQFAHDDLEEECLIK